MLKSAADVLASEDVGTIVDFAIEANRTVVSTTRELASVKSHLRALAEERKREEPALTSVKFEGHLGVAQIVMPTKPVLRARKGMRLADLKRVLPAEVYESLFVERVVVDVADTYEEGFSNLSPRQRLVVEKFVESVPQTSRVNLPE
jgi:hypothetical protein